MADTPYISRDLHKIRTRDKKLKRRTSGMRIHGRSFLDMHRNVVRRNAERCQE